MSAPWVPEPRIDAVGTIVEAMSRTFPLASIEVQHRFEPALDLEYAHHWHCVHVVEPGIFVRWDEDGDAGAMFYVFREGDWCLHEAIPVPTKTGWKLRIVQAARKLI